MRIGKIVSFYVIIFLTGCGEPQGNFSQWTGFDIYFQHYPPSSSLPSPAERALLERFRPFFYLSHDQQEPIDFYSDYITSGHLTDGKGKKSPAPITKSVLNAHKNDPFAVFEYQPRPARETPKIYARIDRVDILWPQSKNKEGFLFLQYHLVFAHSGLSKGLSHWQEWLLGIFGNLDDWHQLDHYTAVTVVLDAQKKPVAMMMQHHNITRSWIFGETIDLPDDGRVAIDIALRSNELYPHQNHPQAKVAIGYLNAESMDFLMGMRAKKRFNNETWDITRPERILDYQLAFLPTDDAFYIFKGFLGKKRLLPGRDGPPGATYNVFGQLKPLHIQLFFSYWRDGNKEDFDRWQKSFAEASEKHQKGVETIIESLKRFGRKQSLIFEHNLICLRQNKQVCVLQ